MKKRIISLMVSFLLVVSFAVPAKANTNIKVIACNGPFNTITVVSESNDRIFKRLGIFATPGSTLTVSKNYATTISSNANFTIFPELLEMGYEKSFTAGVDIGWQKTNTSNVNQELVILSIYDRVHVVEYYQVTSGSCAVGIDTYYDMPTGWAFDLRA